MVLWVVEVGWMFGRHELLRLQVVGCNRLCLLESVVKGIEFETHPLALVDYSYA